MKYFANAGLEPVYERMFGVLVEVRPHTNGGTPVVHVERRRQGGYDGTMGTWILPNGFTPELLSEIETCAFSTLETWVMHQYGIQAVLL